MLSSPKGRRRSLKVKDKRLLLIGDGIEHLRQHLAKVRGFIQQCIKHGESGFFFETKSPYDLRRKIKLLANDGSLRKRIGREARKTVKEQFDWGITAELIAKALK